MFVIAGKNNIAVHALNTALRFIPKKDIVVLTNKNDVGIHSWQQSLLKKAQENNLTIASLNEIKKGKITRFISLEYDRLLKINEIKADDFFNIHFSALPMYKGMYTSVWPILNNDSVSGVTLHEIDEGIDTGDIYDQIIFSINDKTRAQDLYSLYIKNAQVLFDKNISNIISGNLYKVPQELNKSTYFSKKSIDFSNLQIDLNKTAWEIQRQIYAYSFRPYQLVKVFNNPIAEVLILGKKSKKKPGTILNETRYYVEIATIDYDIRLMFDQLSNNLQLFATCHKNDVPNLLENICGVNDRNLQGWSPIIVAAYNGNLSVVELLLELGADINDTNANGTSVLMYAKEYGIKTGNFELVEMLIEKGADTSHRDLYDKTVFDYLPDDKHHFLKG